MKKLTAVLLGAGGRGMDSYGSYALDHPNELQFVAVAESHEGRRNKFKNVHGIQEKMCFKDWKELTDKPRLADIMLICTQDRMHFEPTMAAMDKGYHILLEKPVSSDPLECLTISEKARQYEGMFSVCYVARYSSFFANIKKLLDEEIIGRIISIQHTENVAYWHQAHSFVRGNWNNSGTTSPMILQKTCHDMDIFLWYIGTGCVKLSSFGSLTHFTAANAPDGAPSRCLDGCPAEEQCPYYAPGIYLTKNTEWPTSSISLDLSTEGRIAALMHGPYGRCVYKCDNNVVDHQVVNMLFDNEVTVAFTMCGHTYDNGRTIKIMGTKGEIRGSYAKHEIEATDFCSGRRTVIRLDHVGGGHGGHGGADHALLKDFIVSVRNGNKKAIVSAAQSAESHMMAFASEKSRIENRVIDMKEFVVSLRL